MSVRDDGLEYLLELDGETIVLDTKHYVKFEARTVVIDGHRPHGIKYSLTLHTTQDNMRILGFDNAHKIRKKNKFSIEVVEYDHWHRPDNGNKAERYVFKSPDKLLTDFWAEVNKYMGY